MNLINQKVNIGKRKNISNYLKFRDFTIYYNNEESAKQTFQEIFIDRAAYHFETNSKEPLIIDGGANIGIATLFFKICHPTSKIICFEPDPNAFFFLQKNIEHNKLKDVFLINAALSDEEGTIDFYGQIHTKNPDARGNSIFESWGGQRKKCDKIQVNSNKLSDYINTKIDFLKLDIEGAEECVLTEIKDKLHWVNEIHLEFHETKLIYDKNSLDNIKKLLTDHDFELDILLKEDVIFPAQVKNWVKKAYPQLYLIKATKRRKENQGA